MQKTNAAAPHIILMSDWASTDTVKTDQLFFVCLFVLKNNSSKDQHPMHHSDSGDVSNHDHDDDDHDDDDHDDDVDGDADDIQPRGGYRSGRYRYLITVRRASWKQVSPSAGRLSRIPVHYSYFPYMSSFSPSAVAKSRELR